MCRNIQNPDDPRYACDCHLTLDVDTDDTVETIDLDEREEWDDDDYRHDRSDGVWPRPEEV